MTAAVRRVLPESLEFFGGERHSAFCIIFFPDPDELGAVLGRNIKHPIMQRETAMRAGINGRYHLTHIEILTIIYLTREPIAS